MQDTNNFTSCSDELDDLLFGRENDEENNRGSINSNADLNNEGVIHKGPNNDENIDDTLVLVPSKYSCNKRFNKFLKIFCNKNVANSNFFFRRANALGNPGKFH